MNHCVVLNNAYQVVGSIPETDAICLITTGKAWASKSDPNKVYRSQHVTIPAPRVVVLNHYVKITSFRIRPEKLTNFNLFRRDNFTCGYCGGVKGISLKKGDRLEREHIIPLSKNGKDIWDNVVTACSTCNHFKADKTPEEAGMKLKIAPYVPVTWVIRGKSKLTQEQVEYVEMILNIKNKSRI